MKQGIITIERAQPVNRHQQRSAASTKRSVRDKTVRAFLNRMKERRRERGKAYRSGLGQDIRGRMRKRKMALALSAGIMTLSTAATDYNSQFDPVPAAFVDPDVRQYAGKLKVSDTMKEALAQEEGVRLIVYRDVAGYPTVGVGHLVTPEDGLRVGDRITYDQAIDFLEEELRKAERGVVNLLGDLKVKQHEFDALVDLVYNVGEGNVSSDKSPRLNAAIAIRDYDAIAAELHYHHAGGSKANGLVYRSERREAIFTDASYEDPRASGTQMAGDAGGGNTV